VCACVYAWVRLYVSTGMCVCLCVCMCVRVCACVCLFSRVSVRLFVFAFACCVCMDAHTKKSGKFTQTHANTPDGQMQSPRPCPRAL